jgi:serine/threonine protein kinase
MHIRMNDCLCSLTRCSFDFISIASISFGQVWLASYAPRPKEGSSTPRKRRIYALKVQSKYQLIEMGQSEGVVAEVNIMSSLKSPFIIRLYSTFQDKQRVYMLTSLLQGGELEAVMGNEAMDASVAQFYAAGILEGLTYMHRRHIIHRDLKPENVLIDSKGYPVLIDLGFGTLVLVERVHCTP